MRPAVDSLCLFFTSFVGEVGELVPLLSVAPLGGVLPHMAANVGMFMHCGQRVCHIMMMGCFLVLSASNRLFRMPNTSRSPQLRSRPTGWIRDIETTFFDPASVFLSTH